MTLYDIIMGGLTGLFTRTDWSNLGRGEITDEETVKQMLMGGYSAVVNED